MHRRIPIVFVILSAVLFSHITVVAAELRRHEVVVDNHTLVLWEKGSDGMRDNILLLHGRTWSSLPDFDLQVEGEDLSLMDGFNRLGYRTFALDARGYGATARDETGWLTPDRAARDVAGVIEWLGDYQTGSVHLFGWSYGSMVAQLTAQRYPQLVASVVLYGYPIDPEQVIEEPDYPATPPALANTRDNAASDFITPGAISERAVAAYVEAALKADPLRVDWRDLAQWNELDGSKLPVPVLLLQAEFDPLAKTNSHARLFSNLPNANKQWVVLAGGDHAALLESPRERLLRATASFIEWLTF